MVAFAKVIFNRWLTKLKVLQVVNIRGNAFGPKSVIVE